MSFFVIKSSIKSNCKPLSTDINDLKLAIDNLCQRHKN